MKAELTDLKPLPPGSTKVRMVVEVDGNRPVVELARALGDAGAQVVGLVTFVDERTNQVVDLDNVLPFPLQRAEALPPC